MWRTRVGYAGGEQANPTYGNVGDHSECVQVEFDPSVVSYAELVDRALSWYDPEGGPSSGQYAYIVLANDDEQLRIARERADAVSEKIGRPITTRVEPLAKFWPAEDYHQKYYLRSDRQFMGQFKSMFGDDETAFRESTAAMRVNGYLSGDGSGAQLQEEIGLLGLDDAAREHLASVVGEGSGSAGCAVPQTGTPSSP